MIDVQLITEILASLFAFVILPGLIIWGAVELILTERDNRRYEKKWKEWNER